MSSEQVRPQHILQAIFAQNISYNIPLYIENNPVKKLFQVLEMKLETYTPVDPKFVVEKIKFKVFYTAFNIIWFTNAQGSVKIRLAW